MGSPTDQGSTTENIPNRLRLGGTEIVYEVHGHGQPVVYLHASPFVEWYLPLIERLPDMSSLLYRRQPARRSGGGFDPITIARDAQWCVGLMDHIGWPQAHLVGHSYGAIVAMQVALDAPTRVQSVAVLEPAASGMPTSPAAAAALQPVIDAYRHGDTRTAVDQFLQVVCGPGYRSILDRALPGAFAAAVARADLFFQAELPAVRQWTFDPDQAHQITQPILNVRGADTAPRFVEASDLVQAWFPTAEQFHLADAGHLLMVAQPDAMARTLSEFIERQPIHPTST